MQKNHLHLEKNRTSYGPGTFIFLIKPTGFKFQFSDKKININVPLLFQIAICVVYPSLVLLIMTTVPGLYDPGPRLVVLEVRIDEIFGI